MSQTKPSTPLLQALIATAKVADCPERAAIFQQAARSLSNALRTGRHSSQRSVPAIARLHAAAVDVVAGDYFQRSFSLLHEGYRYLVTVHNNRNVSVYSLNNLPLTLGFKRAQTKDLHG